MGIKNGLSILLGVFDWMKNHHFVLLGTFDGQKKRNVFRFVRDVWWDNCIHFS